LGSNIVNSVTHLTLDSNICVYFSLVPSSATNLRLLIDF